MIDLSLRLAVRRYRMSLQKLSHLLSQESGSDTLAQEWGERLGLWAAELRAIRQKDSAALVQHLARTRRALGGMGSLNDVTITKASSPRQALFETVNSLLCDLSAPLIAALVTARDLLAKYDNPGQTATLDQILSSLCSTSTPDCQLLKTVDMWGGSGAVWEVNLCRPDTPEHKRDRRRFWQAIITIANEMDRLGIGIPRSRQIASDLQKWVDSGTA